MASAYLFVMLAITPLESREVALIANPEFEAGRGVIHNENPLPGTTTHALQLWVNLPASEKMAALPGSQRGEPSQATGAGCRDSPSIRQLQGHFVSDAEPNELYVSATAIAEVEIEFEFYPWTGSPNRPIDVDNPKCDCRYPEVVLQIQLEVVDETVESIRVSSMEIERYVAKRELPN